MTRRWLPWVALLAALSPVLTEMLLHAWSFPWAAAWLVFAVLFFALAQIDSAEVPGARQRMLGRVGLVITAILVVVFVGGREPRLARLAVPLGFASMAWLVGRPSPRGSLLALWILPLPSLLAGVAAPLLSSLWLELAERVVPGARAIAPLGPGDPALGFADGARLALHSGFNGIALAWALAGVGIFHRLRLDPGAAWSATARSALFFACWGLPAQALGIAIAGWSHAASGSLALSEAVLGWGWIVPVGIALYSGRRMRARDARGVTG